MAFFREHSTMLLSIGEPGTRRKASVSASDSVSRRSLCPVRNSVPSYVPPTAPPSTHEALSATARCAPGGSVAGLPGTVPVPAPARRGDKRRVASPARSDILQESYLLL